MSALVRHQRLFLIVIVAQLADLGSFLPALARVGIQAEQNPLARGLFSILGSAGPALLKLGALGVVLLVLWRIAVRFPTYAGRSGMLAIVLGLIGAWSNVAVALAR
jgi:hypothetical protein